MSHNGHCKNFLHYGPLKNVYSLVNSIFLSWTLQEFFVLDNLSFLFWLIPKKIYFSSFHNFYIINNLIIFMFWIIQNFLDSAPFPIFLFFGQFKKFCILDHSRIIAFITIPEFLHSGPLPNFYILKHFRIFILRTIQEFSSSGPIKKNTYGIFKDFFIMYHSIFCCYWPDLDGP